MFTRNRLPRLLAILALLLSTTLLLAACGDEGVEDTPALEEQPVLEDDGALDGGEVLADEEAALDTDEEALEEAADVDEAAAATTPEEQVFGYAADNEYVTLDAILDQPEQYYGQTLAGRADIREFIDSYAMTIETEELLEEDALLVIDPKGLIGARALAVDDLASVRGTLRPFVLVDIEQEYGVDLDDGVFVEWETLPVLIADEINPAEPFEEDS